MEVLGMLEMVVDFHVVSLSIVSSSQDSHFLTVLSDCPQLSEPAVAVQQILS